MSDDVANDTITTSEAEELGRMRLRAIWEAYGQSVYITLVCSITQARHAVPGPRGLLLFVGSLQDWAWQGAIERGIRAAENVFKN